MAVMISTTIRTPESGSLWASVRTSLIFSVAHPPLQGEVSIRRLDTAQLGSDSRVAAITARTASPDALSPAEPGISAPDANRRHVDWATGIHHGQPRGYSSAILAPVSPGKLLVSSNRSTTNRSGSPLLMSLAGNLDARR